MEVVNIEKKKITCKQCGQTLLFAEYVKGEIKCPRCREINQIEIKKTEHRATPEQPDE